MDNLFFDLEDVCIGDSIVDHNGTEVYYVFKDNDDVNNSPYDYIYTLEPGNNSDDVEFDIRSLSCYDSKLSHKEILIKAIDLGLI